MPYRTRLSLARLGGEATGVDFSPSALAAAPELATRAGPSLRYVESAIDEVPTRLPEAFDLGYTGVRALNWAPSVRRWAEIVSTMLTRGRRPFLRESFGVYLQTGRALYLDALYLPTGEERVEVSSDLQTYDLGEPVVVGLELTDEGRAYFQGPEPTVAEVRVIAADDGREVLPLRAEALPTSEPLNLTLPFPIHLRHGTYVAEWAVSAGDRRITGMHAVDVRGYKARFSEFLTDRREYLRTDTVVLNGTVEVSHALPYRIDLQLRNLQGNELGNEQRHLDLPVGRSHVELEIALNTELAGHHTLLYTLSAQPDGMDPLPLLSSAQALEVRGPVLLGLNTDRRRYRPADSVNVTLTTRGWATVRLHMSWDTGETALDTIVVLEGLNTLEYVVVAPADGVTRLTARLLGETESVLSTPTLVRA